VTTIAANREMMVSDSRVSIEHKGLTYPAIKIVKVKDAILGAAGNGADCTRFLNWGGDGFKGAEPKWDEPAGTEDECVGLVLRKDGIYFWSRGGPPERIEADYFAIGSGGKAARAAMLLGRDPIQAVEIAIQIDDLHSGGPIQIQKLIGD